MKSDQAAKRPVAARVMRMNNRWPNAGYKFLHSAGFPKKVELEGQTLAQVVDVNPLE
jgi:hypothetical protein